MVGTVAIRLEELGERVARAKVPSDCSAAMAELYLALKKRILSAVTTVTE